MDLEIYELHQRAQALEVEELLVPLERQQLCLLEIVQTGKGIEGRHPDDVKGTHATQVLQAFEIGNTRIVAEPHVLYLFHTFEPAQRAQLRIPRNRERPEGLHGEPRKI